MTSSSSLLGDTATKDTEKAWTEKVSERSKACRHEKLQKNKNWVSIRKENFVIHFYVGVIEYCGFRIGKTVPYTREKKK